MLPRYPSNHGISEVVALGASALGREGTFASQPDVEIPGLAPLGI